MRSTYTELNAAGAEWVWDVQSAYAAAATELFLPFSLRQRGSWQAGLSSSSAMVAGRERMQVVSGACD